ncbi:MAG: response regulator transcription factor [Anaerolineae bacterium]
MSDDTKPTLLIVDDDQGLVRALEFYFKRQGYSVEKAHKGRDGLRKLYECHPDLICLDVMMPGLDGWEVLERIREMTGVPVIMLTARKTEDERVKGLRLGADDYVSKPFSMRELEARIEAVLRRSGSSDLNGKREASYADDYLAVVPERAEVRCDGEIVDLTPTEQKLLFFLVQNRGRLLSIEQILEHVWGFEYTDEKGYVRLYVWRLRQKIEPDPDNPRYILTAHGLGYRFEG